MKTRHDTNEDNANDNARATKAPTDATLATPHAGRAATPALRRALMRDWGPAILATFFLGTTASANDGSRLEPRRARVGRPS